jgi:hypothetical protein
LGGIEQRSASGASDNGQNSGEYLGWMWFGGNSVAPPQAFAKEALQIIHAANSSYRPNAEIIAIGQKTMSNPIWVKMSRSAYLFEKKGHVKSFFYATNNYSIGSAITGYGGFAGGSYAQVDLKIIMKKATGFPFYISGNGRAINNAVGRATTPFTQYVQHKNVVMMLTYTPTDAQTIFNKAREVGGIIANGGTQPPSALVAGTWQKKWYDDFYTRHPSGAYEGNTQKYPVTMMGYNTTNPQYSYLSFTGGTAGYAYSGQYMVVKYNTSYIAVRFFNSNAPTAAPSVRGAIFDQNASLGKLTGFIIEMADASEYATAADYLTNFQTRTTSIDINNGSVSYTMKDGTVLYAKYDANGTFYEALYDWGFGPTTQQTKMHTDHVSPTAFQQPDWTSYAELNNKTGRFPIFKVNNDSQDVKSTTWPVIADDANVIALSGGKLVINNSGGTKVYEADYTGTVPVFSTVTEVKEIKEKVAVNQVKLYPNPAKDIVYIDGLVNETYVTIYDMLGKKVLVAKTNQSVIQLKGLKSGVYSVAIPTEKGVVNQKLIVE